MAEGPKDEEEEEEKAAAATPSFSGRPTGRYELAAVLTHKGRSADSGHYVAWARCFEGGSESGADGGKRAKVGEGNVVPAKQRWLQLDDDDVIERTGEDVLALSGGGDWHMAYLLLYRAELAP